MSLSDIGHLLWISLPLTFKLANFFSGVQLEWRRSIRLTLGDWGHRADFGGMPR